jgi:hypothetical protein
MGEKTYLAAISIVCALIPGITAVGTVSGIPFTGGLHGIPISPWTTEFTLNNAVMAPYVFQMSPGCLKAAGTRLLSGRDFTAIFGAEVYREDP